MVAKFLGSLFGNAAGARFVAEQPEASVTVEDELAVAETSLRELRRTVLGNGAELPTIVVSQVLQLLDVLRTLIGYIRSSGASTEQHVLLSAVITDYVPVPVGAYLMLPASSRNDQSAETAVLLEQLDILYSTVKNLDRQVRTGAKTELAIHGRFLKDKFNIEGLELEGR
ncbi:hypothetical protein [Arthrobacter bambusae]|uniref:Uncharacterized protein n=1 Tax=Arthrobacter bambusae TaxID=1338426 RepID=A0AAW8D9P5_9MICC|nr:hypothetical protein [Arthrobacter bambusae]MDP9905636.1 hypothetical protein [Arthrobacter bambusae]MDQ0127282.1 hypothetical protein [Arthrobacter bambusae]MDQ0178624.1 hypothetical protein [Arthrobacter bambusae]